ncbi:MAG: fibronectin type III domain-containing protein, partial [Methanomicrobia archaeon]|nr:fibronectin type III domain-containing protein [Methanomicrobia archaeon]
MINMNKKTFFLILMILVSLTFLNASHLSTVTINPEAINTTGYVDYSVVVYNTSGDPIKEIKFENTTGDGNRQFYYSGVTASNWNFTVAGDHLSATGTPNTTGYRIEVGETLTITVNAKVLNLTSSGQITIMRIVTKDTANFTDPKQFSIIYDTQKPSAPTLKTPENGATINNVRPTLEWNAASDSGSGIKSYTLQVSPNDSFIGTGTITKANLTNTSYTITSGEQLNEDTYYWRVYAIDNAGNISLSSTIRSFNIYPVPNLISPANDIITNDATPLFEWSSVPYASSYTLQISTSSSFGTITLEKTISGTEYELQLSESLANDTYYWRVKTDISTGYSEYYRLEVNKNIPSLISPPDNAEITESRP